MNPISINSRKFLRTFRFPDGLLLSGLAVSATLLALLCVVGGISTFIGIGCVLIFGSGLGFLLKVYDPYKVLSCITGGFILLTASSAPPAPKAA